MNNEFYVGQEVCCINANENYSPSLSRGIRMGGHPVGTLDGLEKGKIYTIAGFERGNEIYDDGLILLEVVRPQIGIYYERKGFWVGRFRPVVKTDISIFEAMLAPSPKRVNA